MARGEEETSTSQAGRIRGPARKARSASHIVSSLTMEELRTYYEIPDNIDLKLIDKLDESTLGGRTQCRVFYLRTTCGRTSFFSACPCQTVFAFHQDPDSNRMQCSEYLIPARPFIGRDLLCLYFDSKVRGSDVYVNPGFLAAVCERTPRFS